MKTVAIIPARSGSQRIPGKNIRSFHGRPIIEYSIETAQRSRLFDQIIVSTDGDAIEAVAKSAGAWVYRRQADDGSRGTQEVAAEVLRDGRSAATAFACVIYPTAPMLTAHDLWLGYQGMLVPGRTYSHATGPDGVDLGWFYWGPACAFAEVPLNGNSYRLGIEKERAIDINAADDWSRAEQMYAAWALK